jgi:hypothetical protein
MTDTITTESREREGLLLKLFDLMEKSDNIRVLPADRIATIKEKYRAAPLENIQSGIKMLEADIEQKMAEQKKEKLFLQQSIDKRNQLREQEKMDIIKSEKLVRQLYTQIGNVNNPKRKKRWLLILVLALCLAALIFYLRKNVV